MIVYSFASINFRYNHQQHKFFIFMNSKLNPINLKLQKFGRTVKAKIKPQQQRNNFSVQNIQTNSINQKQFNRNLFNFTSPKYQDIEPETKSLNTLSRQDSMRSQFNQKTYSPTNNKNVRFSFSNNYSLRNSPSQKKTNHIPPMNLNFKKNKSILKNNLSRNNSVQSINSCINSQVSVLSAKYSVKDQGSSVQLDKFQKLHMSLKQKKTKYFDNVFPPGSASLFYNKKNKNFRIYEELRWVRIQDLYKNKKIILKSQPTQYSNRRFQKSIFSYGILQSMNYMLPAFNSLNQRCLERIFQDQKYNLEGIYVLRINHSGIWKYIIIDDFIPVTVNQLGQFEPAFLKIKGPIIQIWPLLIQKALSKIYSCYQCLQNDSVQNCMYQLTGFVSQEIQLQNELVQFQIRSSILKDQYITIAKSPIRYDGIKQMINIQQSKKFCRKPENRQEQLFVQQYYPIYCKNTTKLNNLLLQLHESKTNKKMCLDLEYLKKHFKKILIYKNDETLFSIGATIKQAKQTISIRSFKILQYTNCDISLIQKDKKYFRNTGYNYHWCRVIVCLKETSGLRFINGDYSNEKVINLNFNLQEGQYYVIIMADWNNRTYELNLNYQGNQEIKFVRQTAKQQQILNEVCNDLAQRFGTFKQLTKYLFSYRYIDNKLGLIVENMHNESMREIFYRKKYYIRQSSNYEILNESLTEDKELEVFIDSQKQYTFILKFINGIDLNVINAFSFGNK